MNKKLNAFLRILTVLAAVTAVVFAFLLKGKIDTALTKTAWAVNDPELKAGKDYDARMASLATLPALLDGKRKAIAELVRRRRVRALLPQLAALRASLPEQTYSGVETIRAMGLHAENGERLKPSPRD